jgi:hypothetical protein
VARCDRGRIGEGLWGATGLIDPARIADTFLWLHRQTHDAWTFELDLRPSGEPW